ncbi:hypothetical protein [Tropicibacter naphthalenivorans]|uniref:hypothetical protein n=1 Tax=Tropicibacter naphthalenivorans TaxID=441103 RepID=UPI00117EA32A|nr:hypothetical protein [Tropicibacter naphthalenivorans]
MASLKFKHSHEKISLQGRISTIPCVKSAGFPAREKHPPIPTRRVKIHFYQMVKSQILAYCDALAVALDLPWAYFSVVAAMQQRPRHHQ